MQLVSELDPEWAADMQLASELDPEWAADMQLVSELDPEWAADMRLAVVAPARERRSQVAAAEGPEERPAVQESEPVEEVPGATRNPLGSAGRVGAKLPPEATGVAASAVVAAHMEPPSCLSLTWNGNTYCDRPIIQTTSRLII